MKREGYGKMTIEALRLHIKDIIFNSIQIIGRETKGNKDGIITIPKTIIPELLGYNLRNYKLYNHK